MIVNTCAFLEAAREEAIDAILDAAAYKKQRCRLLIVAGCLPMRYLDDVRGELPEVDLWLLPDRYADAGRLIGEALGVADVGQKAVSRLLTTPPHYAYLKIADGCNNRCTFCMIPSIRGAYRSESPDALVTEAKALVIGGVKELILVAQDTTRYGSDRQSYGTLAELIPKLTAIEGLETVRLLYCYPERITDELIDVIASDAKVAPYLDIPMQHASDRILHRMNRRSTRRSLLDLIAKLRSRIPKLAIRTTMMIGFPGETEEDVDSLCNFLEEAQLDRVGFFTYSKEEDTPSALLDGQVSEDEKQARLYRVAAVQQAIAFKKAADSIGKTIRVRYEDVDYDRGLFIGRPLTSAPDLDPVVYFSADYAEIGENYDVKVTAADGYDLIAVKENV